MNKRVYPCYLSSNASCETPSRFVAVDTEASITKEDNREVHRLRLGEAYYVRRKDGRWRESRISFTTAKEFYEAVSKRLRKKEPLRIIAHNMAYDANLLDIGHFLSSAGFKLTKWVLEPYIIEGTSEYGNIKILSSTNWFHSSLKDTGKIFGVEKSETPDFTNVDTETLREYCRQDAFVLARILERYIDWIKEKDLGNFADTIAGQAFACLRHKYLPPKSILLHREPEIERLERESYLGGRCEAFRLGTFEEVYKLDVNSMYPFVMRNNNFPVKMISGSIPRNGDTIFDTIDNDYNDKYVIADCLLELKENSIGVRRNDKLVFPVGKIKTALTSPEIKYIMDHPEIGTIHSIEKGAIYETMPIFRDYVDYFYDIKQHTEIEAEKLMSKLFLNSVYGKFGQKDHTDIVPISKDMSPKDRQFFELAKMDMEELGISSILSLYQGQICKYVMIGTEVYRAPSKTNESSSDAFPAIAGAVTSLARLYLDSLIRIAQKENVYYTDTDSLIVTKEGYEKLRSLIHPNRLGALKIEGVGDIEINGLKNYRFACHNAQYVFDFDSPEIKLKGIRKDAVKVGEHTYRQSQWCTKASHLSKGHEPGTVVVEYIEKTISGDYDKGIVGTNGIISPFIFSEW